MGHVHLTRQDAGCPRCGMLMQTYIPHECDPSICKRCDGKGTIFVGRLKNRRWEGTTPCDNERCHEGRITFDKD